MYICLCKGVTEEKLRSLAETSRNSQEILKKLGIGDDCGVCLIAALDKIIKEKNKYSLHHTK